MSKYRRRWRTASERVRWLWAVWHGIIRGTPQIYPARLNHPTKGGKLAARPVPCRCLAKALTNSTWRLGSSKLLLAFRGHASRLESHLTVTLHQRLTRKRKHLVAIRPISPPQLSLGRPTGKRASRRFAAQPRSSRCGMQLSTSHRRCRCDQVLERFRCEDLCRFIRTHHDAEVVEEVVEGAPRASSCSLAGSVCHAVDEYVETLPSIERLLVTHIFQQTSGHPIREM